MLFELKKMLTSLVLPPGIFILVLILIGSRLAVSRRHLAGLGCIVVALAMWLLSTMPVANRLTSGLESRYSQSDSVKGDVIILLGGGYSPVPDLTGEGFLKNEMLGRIITAARLQKKLDIPIIISSGTNFENVIPDSIVAKRFLVDLDVDENKVFCDTQSRDTYENAKYSKEICQEHGFEHPILMTSGSHMKRAVMIFEKQGMQVTPFPAYFRSAPHMRFTWQTWLPRHDSFSNSVKALHEYLGYIYYQWAY